MPQSVSFVRVDMEEGAKQLDKMALMCLKNLLSLIKAHTHAAQKADRANPILRRLCRVTLLPLAASVPLSLCAGNQDQVGSVGFFFFSDVTRTESHCLIPQRRDNRDLALRPRRNFV